MPSAAISRDNTTVASRWPKVVAGDGSVRSSAGTYTAWIEVVEPLVAEALGHGEAGERHAQSVARRLVHLAENHRHLRLAEVLLHDDLGVRHLVVEVVALAGALAYAGEDGEARMLCRDVVDEL